MGQNCSFLDVGKSSITYPNQPQVAAAGADATYNAASWGGSIARDDDARYRGCSGGDG